mgnify:CR=1 FL=1
MNLFQSSSVFKLVPIIIKALLSQKTDGVFPELGGGDTSYQGVSLAHLSEIAMFMDTDTIIPALKRGIKWELTHIKPDGEIEVLGNTRTGLGQEVYYGKPKEVDGAAVVRALSEYAALTGDENTEHTAFMIAGRMHDLKK